jgi:cytochrome b involved in lipid metabolism
MNTKIIINGHVFDVTNYIGFHPGEGIRDIYLCEKNNKDVSAGFEYYHMTNEPNEILEEVIRDGEKYGIKYLGRVDNQN